MTEPQTAKSAEQTEKVGIGAYVALAIAIVLFSGVFYKMPEAQKWLGAFLNFPKNLHSNTGTGDYFPKKVISS